MPWSTPTLSQVRSLVRDGIHSSLPGSDATIPNSVLRVVGDVQGALCFLTLEYVDWLSLQLLPDTAEQVWLDRFGDIWLVNSDGTVGRKQSTFASGTVTVTGSAGSVLPSGSLFSQASVNYQSTEQIVVGSGPSQVAVEALTPGTIGNLLAGSTITLTTPPPGLDSTATVIEMEGGNEPETDDQLRARILLRIREPPMGGDAKDYVQWTLSIPGVTRAWSYPREMGMGTCTVRFMMDDLRSANNGFPTPDDVANVAAYLDTVRPVAVKDFFVEAPIPHPINVHITYLNPDTQASYGAIEQSLLNEFLIRTLPGQTWFRAWTDEGIMAAVPVIAYDLVGSDTVMPSPGYMPVLGDITYG